MTVGIIMKAIFWTIVIGSLMKEYIINKLSKIGQDIFYLICGVLLFAILLSIF